MLGLRAADEDVWSFIGDAHAEFFGDGRRSDLLFFSSSAVAAVVALFFSRTREADRI